jgi:hypothetical protein
VTVPQVSRATKRFTDELVARQCETDAVLPAQFFPKSASVTTGEQRLMVAVLEDAIALHFKRIPSGTKLRPKFLQEQGQADHWLRSNDRVSAFSFLRICEAVNLDPQCVRDCLHVLHETNGHRWSPSSDIEGHRHPQSRRGSPGRALTTPVEHQPEERSAPRRTAPPVQKRPPEPAITTRPAK